MVESLKLARELASSEDPERMPMNCFLAIILFSRYQSIGGRDLLLEAIEIVETTIPDMADGHELSISSKLGDMYWNRYELDRGFGDLRLAIENTPNTHSQRCYRLLTLSESLHKLHRITRDEEVLAEAILYGEEALTCAGDCPNETQNCHFTLGDMQFSKYKVSRDNNDEDQSKNDLDLSVNHLEEAARHAPVDDRNCSPIFVTLGDVLGFRFALTKRREDVSRAIENLERGLQLMSETDPTLQPTIMRLYFLLFTRYQTFGDRHDLERALYHAERILAISPEQGPYRAGDLYRIGHLHLDLFNATKDDDQLRLAVEYCRNAVSELVAGSDSREVVLFGYATALSVMSERRGDMDFLEEALEKTRMVIDMSQPNDPNWATYLRNNAIMLFRRFRCEGSETDLREATRLAKEAKEHIPRQNPDYAEVLTILCSLQSNSFSLSRNMDDIDEAIRYGQESIEVQQNKVQEARCLFNLGNALFEKFEKSTLKDDLDAAIDMQLKAVSDVEDPNRPEYLSDLANKLRDRYFMYRDQTDLDAAVERGTLAVELLKPDHPYRAHAEGNLGIILHQVHLVNGSLEILERAISLCESAISTINSKFLRHRDRPRIHNHLGGMRYARFERKGAEEDLNQAVDHGREALEHARLTDPARQIYMANLAEALRQRFDVFGRLQDVEYAITLCETIVDTTASDHPRRATRLRGLSNMFFSKYNRTFEPEDLEKSIKYGREAKSASLPTQPHWAEFCHSLGIFLCTKFQKTGFRNDIEEALNNLLEAVDGTSRHHIQRDIFVASLGSICHQRYQKFNDDNDLDQAICYGFEALETAPIYSPRRAMLLFNLARWLGSRSWIGRDENDRELSKRLFLEVLDLDSATVMTRARAGTIIALQCINDEDWQEAYDALQKVIELLPRISPRTLARGDQQHTLKEFSEVASLAASCASQLGKTDAEAL
ncbi:hypothetical protein HG530_006527 [Fusarium avenaceum]|nr:hypothetical protein HG530_006527 [Fusarium avenaceum]